MSVKNFPFRDDKVLSGLAIVTARPGSRRLVGRDIGIRRLVSPRRRPLGAPSPFFRTGGDPTRLSIMASPESQLSAIADQVTDLARRVAETAAELDRDEATDAATALYEVERSLNAATRSLDRARRAL